MLKGLLGFLSGLGIAAFVVVMFVMIVLMPLAYIWAINTLFGLGIDYSFVNWLAMLLLSMLFASSSSSGSSK